MGYPSLKFFPVNADKKDLGELRTSHSKEIHVRKSDEDINYDLIEQSYPVFVHFISAETKTSSYMNP